MKQLPGKLQVFLMIVMAMSGCQKDLRVTTPPHGTVKVNFKPVIDGLPLDFVTTYRNAWGEDFTVKTLRYYISNIQFINTSKSLSTTLPNNYFLVDAANQSSSSISINMGEETYDQLAFTIGVDSIRNVSGAQTGALDPANGMFWTWNSGYIMAKFEGTSGFSSEPGNRFEYHIGGFKSSENVVKQIKLSFPSQQNLQVIVGKIAEVNVNANANTWFNGASRVSISATPACTTPGVLAQTIAANYANMFSVSGVVNNE